MYFTLQIHVATEEALLILMIRRKTMKIEEFEKFKNMSIDEVDENELVDIKSVEVRMDLPPKERLQHTLDQVKNPYFFKVGKYIVKSTFSEDSGCTIGDCVKGLLML